MDKVAWLMASFLRACGISVSGQVDIAKELEGIQNTPIFFRVQYTSGERDENDSWLTWPRYKFYRATDSDISLVDEMKRAESGDSHLTNKEEVPF